MKNAAVLVGYDPEQGLSNLANRVKGAAA